MGFFLTGSRSKPRRFPDICLMQLNVKYEMCPRKLLIINVCNYWIKNQDCGGFKNILLTGIRVGGSDTTNRAGGWIEESVVSRVAAVPKRVTFIAFLC